ncbi:hypothetical protein [Pseudomonas sp. CMR5c]|uniref:hypothetical protein n=1 Tax=Pseudomonas sp. CMR5c TaxID=658630 RepID=UPI00069DEBF4|nr:hypothetical protein [Pseudomonas sp. CMR5c]AZC19572.1 hypothetical protein C4K40_4191 [Pseudomonas sp. CMR5c]
MNKHTPGPWSSSEPYQAESGAVVVSIDAPTHGALAEVIWQMEDDHDESRPSPECQANAHLLTAAPELRRALEDCVRVMELDLAGLRVIQPELNQARAALAAARGDL